METDTETLCKQLSSLLNAYSDCERCGQVIKNPALLVPDPLNKGSFKSLCPECNHETRRTKFPPVSLRPVFDMMIESAQAQKAILVLVLACTVFEVFVDGLLLKK